MKLSLILKQYQPHHRLKCKSHTLEYFKILKKYFYSKMIEKLVIQWHLLNNLMDCKLLESKDSNY